MWVVWSPEMPIWIERVSNHTGSSLANQGFGKFRSFGKGRLWPGAAGAPKAGNTRLLYSVEPVKRTGLAGKVVIR